MSLQGETMQRMIPENLEAVANGHSMGVGWNAQVVGFWDCDRGGLRGMDALIRQQRASYAGTLALSRGIYNTHHLHFLTFYSANESVSSY